LTNKVTYRTSSRGNLAPHPDDGSLKAAAQVFFEQGYAATSINAIIERIGGSKRNIYSEFGSKEGVFTALVSESADAALAALSVERFGWRNLSESCSNLGGDCCRSPPST